ncbi:hypothetical protein GQ55_2G233900 [Panicum hallii var. hallii]|uniref:LOB domain-containing protein n=1 Tax=Panicum hallii var. hallii TaxID=1504633 RepID=A0A2T7ERN5_9POAL|nr:hypothetical protein GQ55_2G233900 [Panicum hallii var. hallii]
MSSSSSSASKPPPPPLLRLHVDTTAATTTNGSAASPGSASSSHSSRSPRPSAAGPGGSQNQNQACAACKYQRRKCNPDCPLAPYFPADQQRRFLNAHRLFGVKKIQKTLRWIDPERGPDAMRALIFQSEARAADPVGGCVTIIEQLQRQIERTELELAYVKQQIAIYRQAAAVDPLGDPAMILPAAAAVAGQDHQDNAAGAVGALYAGQEPIPPGAGIVFHDQQGYHVVKVDDQQNHPPPPQQLYNYFCHDGTADDTASSQDGSVQQYGGFADTGGLKIGSPVALGEQLEQQCRLEAAPPFVDAFDVKPQGLRATTERRGPADLVYPEDQHMEEAATAAAAPCHLELGFSSF